VPPRLVVLDSVADLIRGEEAPAPGKGWSTYAALRRVARLLRTFSERHRVAVLCVNQVTANVGTGTLKPALGLTWAQEMDRSYMVSKRAAAAVPAAASASSKGTENAPGLATNQLRTMELSRSSQFGPHQAQFTVQAWGISMMPT
jgi:RecA/RadA recombinase